MENDKVMLTASATERDGQNIYSAEISEKPQFMLDEEYKQIIIECAVQAVKKACKAVYGDNKRMIEIISQKIAYEAQK